MRFFVPALCCTATLIAPAAARAQLAADPPAVDFGPVRLFGRAPGATEERTITLRNAGPRPVRVTRLDLPCGCLSVDIGGDGDSAGALAVIPPGGTAAVTLTLDTARTPPGPLEKTLRVYADGDPTRPAAEVRVSGRVVPALRFDPPALFANGAAPATLTVEADRAALKSPADLPAPKLTGRLTGVTLAADGLAADDPKAGVIRRRFTLRVAPGAPLGLSEGRAEVSVLGAGSAVCPVSVTVPGPVRAEPALLAWDDAASGAERPVLLIGETAAAVVSLRAASVEAGGPTWLTARLDPSPAAPTTPPTRVLRVGVAPTGGTPGEHETAVSVTLADGRRLVVPVRLRIGGTAAPGPAATMIGQPALPFTLPDADGKPVAVPSATAGRPLALFFFCGCEACAKVAVEWGRLRRGGALPAGTETVLVYHEVSPDGARTLARDAGLTAGTGLRLLMDDGAPGVGARLYGADRCPRVFVVDGAGRIRHTNAYPDAPAAEIAAGALSALRAAVQAAPSRTAASTPRR